MTFTAFILVCLCILDFALPLEEQFISNGSLDDVTVEWYTKDVYEHPDENMHDRDNNNNKISGCMGNINAADDDFAGYNNGTYKPVRKHSFIYNPMTEVMRRPEMSEFLGQVLPIIRSMSPSQKLILAALLSTHLMSSSSASLSSEQVIAMFGMSSVFNKERRGIRLNQKKDSKAKNNQILPISNSRTRNISFTRPHKILWQQASSNANTYLKDTTMVPPTMGYCKQRERTPGYCCEESAVTWSYGQPKY